MSYRTLRYFSEAAQANFESAYALAPGQSFYQQLVQAMMADGSGQRAPTKFFPINALAVATPQTIWTPATGKKFVLMGCLLAGTGLAINLAIHDGATPRLYIPLLTLGAAVFVTFQNGYVSQAANNALLLAGSGLAVISGTVWGTEE